MTTSDSGSGGKKKSKLPGHVDTVLQVLGWSAKEMEALAKACSLISNDRFYFFLTLSQASFDDALTDWQPPSRLHVQQLQYLRLHYIACERRATWAQEFTNSAFLDFMVARAERLSAEVDLAPSGDDPDGDDGASGTPSPDGSATGPTPDQLHDRILLSAGLSKNDNLRRNVLFQLNHVTVAVSDQDRRVWRETPIKLSSASSADILEWYGRLRDEAVHVGVHLCSLQQFKPGFAVFPTFPTKEEIVSMDDILNRKLRQSDTLPRSDPTVSLLFARYFGATPQSLAAFRFLHDLLQHAFTAIRSDVLVMPTFDTAETFVDFAKRLVQYQDYESMARKRTVTDWELSHQFLTTIAAAQAARVDHFVDDLGRLDQDAPLPARLTVTQLAGTIPADPTFRPTAPFVAHRVNTRSRGRHPTDSTRPTRRSNQSTVPSSTSPFYQPDPDATCSACLRPGHRVANCIFLARFGFLAKYAQAHPDTVASLVDKYETAFAVSNRRAHARSLVRHDPQFHDATVSDVARSDDVDLLLEEDFHSAGCLD